MNKTLQKYPLTLQIILERITFLTRLSKVDDHPDKKGVLEYLNNWNLLLSLLHVKRESDFNKETFIELFKPNVESLLNVVWIQKKAVTGEENSINASVYKEIEIELNETIELIEGSKLELGI